MPSETTKRQHYQFFRKREPVRWANGEREALIEIALAAGKVKQVPRGASGYEIKPELPPQRRS